MEERAGSGGPERRRTTSGEVSWRRKRRGHGREPEAPTPAKQRN